MAACPVAVAIVVESDVATSAVVFVPENGVAAAVAGALVAIVAFVGVGQGRGHHPPRQTRGQLEQLTQLEMGTVMTVMALVVVVGAVAAVSVAVAVAVAIVVANAFESVVVASAAAVVAATTVLGVAIPTERAGWKFHQA